MSARRQFAAIVILLLANGCERDGSALREGPDGGEPPRVHVRGGRSSDTHQSVELAVSAPTLEARADRATAVNASDPSGRRPDRVPDDQKLILTAHYRVEVKVLDSALVRLKRDILASGGFVTREDRREMSHEVLTATIVCRIPAFRSRQFLVGIAGLGAIENAQENAEDITEQTIDLEARLTNQKKLEASLQGLLSRKEAELSDVLSVERELARVRSEIEGLEGRKRYWDRQVAYATATFDLHEPLPVIAAASGGVGPRFAASFRTAGENLVATTTDIIAALGALIPLTLLAVGLYLPARTGLRRIRRARRAGTA